MSCVTTYSCPITIPTGTAGASVTGPAGANGASVLVNTIAESITSSGTGSQTLKSVNLTAGSMAAGDILEYEAYITLSAGFAGSIQLLLGSQPLLTYVVTADAYYTPPVGETTYHLILKTKILFLTAAAQTYTSIIECAESTSSFIRKPPANCGQDSANTLALKLDCDITTGTIICKYFTVTKYVKS